MTQTIKRLKITDAKGNEKTIPATNGNKKFYEEHRNSLTREKKEKYKIEEIEFTIEEAAELGIYEAYEKLNPPTKKGAVSQQSNDIVAMLMKQNQDLAERLAIMESKQDKPVKK